MSLPLMGITSINPATGEPIATYRELTDAEVFGAVEAAHAAWNDWRTRSFAARGDLLRATARVTFWGALAMALTAGIGKLFGTVV